MSKTSKLKKRVKKQQKYLSYYEMTKKAKRVPMTYANWSKNPETNTLLSNAGIDWEKDKPSARLRSKKGK